MATTHDWGVNNPKISVEQIEQIRALAAQGVGRAELIEQFHVSGSTIWHITRGFGARHFDAMSAQVNEATERARDAEDALAQIRRYLTRAFELAESEAEMLRMVDVLDIIDDVLPEQRKEAAK